MLSRVHAIAGTMAMVIIASFWSSTLVSELFLDYAAVASVKQTIVYGFFLLVPCMAATGGTGFKLSKTRIGAVVGQKRKRMAIIGANGLLLMIPLALFLNGKAMAEEFDTAFNAAQLVELTIGAVQLTFIGLNFRDGLRLTGKLRSSAANPLK